MSGSCLITNFLLTKIGPRSYHLLERWTKVSTGSFPFSSLRIGREQHVLDSSNHSPHHFDTQSTVQKRDTTGNHARWSETSPTREVKTTQMEEQGESQKYWPRHKKGHSEHCLTIIASFHIQSVVHTIGENQKRDVVKVVLEICSTSIKLSYALRQGNVLCRLLQNAPNCLHSMNHDPWHTNHDEGHASYHMTPTPLSSPRTHAC